MDKHELFKAGLEAREAFKPYPPSDLQSIGLKLGSNEATFKGLYLAYLKGEESYENNPVFGVKIEVTFKREKDEMTIKRATTELTFTEAAFVAYLNLIHLCFGDIHPVGTVVELDESRLSAEIAPRFVSDDEVRYVVLTGRKVSLPGAYTAYVVDYIGRMWPEGEGSKVTPLLISNLMIKRIIHQGLVLDGEEATDLTLREQLVTGMRQSLAFASEEKQVQIMKDLNLPTAGTTETSNEKEVN